MSRQLDTAKKEKEPSPEDTEEDAGKTEPASSSTKGETDAETIEELRQENSCLKETLRSAQARIEEMRRALASTERKYKQQVDELTQRLNSIKKVGQDSELENLRQRLRTSEESRNVLANSIEGKEVQWKSKFESMEQEMEELKRKHETELRETTIRLEAEVSDLRQGSKPYPGDRAGQVLLQAHTARPSPLARLGLDGVLRCPFRSSASALPVDGEVDPARYRPAHCQTVVWQTLNAVQDVLALLCSACSYTILEASKNACRTWGSSALQGKSVLTLMNSSASRAWLREAFETHQRLTEDGTMDVEPSGFLVRDLGNEAFMTKAGDSFDSTVIMINLPAEPSLRKKPALLMIIEPNFRANSSLESSCSPSVHNNHNNNNNTTTNNNNNNNAHIDHQQSGDSSRRGRSSLSSRHLPNQPSGARRSSSQASTSSVTPSDSASNIHANNSMRGYPPAGPRVPRRGNYR